MLSVDVLRDTAKEGEGDGSLDILVTVNRGSNRFDDTLADPIVASKCANLFLVLFSESEGSELVFLLVNVVGLEDRREDREAVFGVERSIEVVTVYSGDFLQHVSSGDPYERRTVRHLRFLLQV